jgi:DNA polymerase-3 subunit epsilon
VAHNAPFDRGFLLAELDRHQIAAPVLRGLPWIDTLHDIPFATQPDSKKLKYLASDHGFINPFAHRAVFDVLTMLRVLSEYDLSTVVGRAQTPDIIIRAVVPHPKRDGGLGKDKAKLAGFRWQDVDGKQYPLMWVKKIKESELGVEQAKLPDYQVIRIV